ncbi:unnamed protein product [Staurois parvus]|uniref:Uncharacterized protein n=1 Tax=Staurois parvus TaxID=386267 RepID=A0ABN9AKU7_9NEOB|nr:unnamed protein product [Staurois parvus]
MGGHTALYDKMEPTSSVRRHFTGPKPECGATVWRWRQQQWEAIQHPMTKWNPPAV